MLTTLERSREAAIWSAFRHTSRRLLQRAKPARAGFVSLMSIAAALGAPQQAWANDVTVTIMGTVTSGFDTTGVFGAANTDLAGNFTLIYMLDDRFGASCRQTISCIKDSPTFGNPMTKIMLMIAGQRFDFSNSDFSVSLLNQEASRHLNYGGHAALLDFEESEYYSLPYSGSSSIKAQLYVNSVWAQLLWTQEVPCWEGALPLYTLYSGDSQPSPFSINVLEKNKAKYKAQGTLLIRSITIQPAQQPPNQCFVGASPR